ncbi:DUF4097 family beta strand repeat-containing protein [Streptomyces decoyicus]|uniref:hypothetical protein n=1 Tax=Streptomyces decoyicus TaxID=249567 RepID=UPI003653A258
MLNHIHNELATNFVDEFTTNLVNEIGVSEPTAAMAAHLYLAVTSSVEGEDAKAQEFQQALQQVAAQGESWAVELLAKIIEKRLPVYRTTYQHALAHGQEPAAALMRTHSLPIAAARDLLTLLTSESGSYQEQRDTPSARPVLANIHLHNGQVTVTIDPTATAASARVHTKDTTGPSAKAAREATIQLVGDELRVTVPEPGPTVIGNSYYFHGGTSFQNFSSGGTLNASPIEIDVTLPPGSGLKLRGHNSNLTVNGPLAALDIHTHNGNLRAGTLGKAKIRALNGNSTIDAIQDGIDSETHNGTTNIGTYSGDNARLVTHNGGIHLTASRLAKHQIDARSHNGPITLRGVSGRTDLRVTTTSHHGPITEF